MSASAGGDAADARNRRLWTAAIFLSVAVIGAILQVRGAVLPTLEGFYTVPEWQLGLVAPAGTVGYLLVILVVGSGAGHVDTRRLIVAGALGTGVALLAMGAAPTFLFFLGAIAVRGAMTGFVRALDRPLLSHFYPSGRGRVYNIYDGIWAVGAATGPLAVVVALRLGSWQVVYAALGVAFIALAALFWRLDTPAVESAEQPLTRERLGDLLRRPEVVALLVVLFLATGVEGGLFTWLPYYAQAELPESWAAVTLTAMLVAYVPGRFAYGVLVDRLGPLTLLVGVLGALVPAFAFTFFLADGLWVLAGVVVIGLLISGVYPTMMTYATDAVPEYSGPVNALAATAASASFGVVPAVMGVVVGGADAATAMRLLVAPLVVALGVVALARVAEGRRAAREAADVPAVDD